MRDINSKNSELLKDSGSELNTKEQITEYWAKHYASWELSQLKIAKANLETRIVQLAKVRNGYVSKNLNSSAFTKNLELQAEGFATQIEVLSELISINEK